MRKKLILFIIFIIYAIFALLNSGYTSIEEKIIDDTNTGFSINAERIVDLFVIEEPSDEFYVCVGETSADRLCVLSIQYTKSGFVHSKELHFSKNELFDKQTRTLEINGYEIVYGFIENSEESIEINGKYLDVFMFSYLLDNENKTTGFGYYVKENQSGENQSGNG